jgi:hypothetical protein
MTRYVLTPDPLTGYWRLNDPTRQFEAQTVAVITDPEAAEWLRGMMGAEGVHQRIRHDLQFMVDSIIKDKAEVAETYPELFRVIQQRRAEMGTLGGVQVFGEIARDLLKMMDAALKGAKP